MHDETREAADLLYEEEEAEFRDRRRAARVALVAIAAMCGALALVTVI